MEQTEIRYMDAIENHCKVDAILNGTKKVELNIDVDKFPLQPEAGVIGMKVGDLYKPTERLTYEIRKIYPPELNPAQKEIEF